MPISKFKAQSPGRILNGTVISTIEASQAIDDNGTLTTCPLEPGSSEQTDTQRGERLRLRPRQPRALLRNPPGSPRQPGQMHIGCAQNGYDAYIAGVTPRMAMAMSCIPATRPYEEEPCS
ncbi:hypothetical protein DL768_003581 [Monosporascus sp. mg162]|nr:hypothetical protein DL768_003581 [Monosporascus sp. mg162]